MIRLVHQDCHPQLVSVLAPIAGRFAPLTAAFVGGRGPWDFFLPRTPGNKTHLTYRLSGGKVAFASPSELALVPNQMLMSVKIAVAKTYIQHNHDLDREADADCAVLLRPAAYVFLSGFPDFGNFYVQLPGISGHEALADPDLLAAEFPGIFEVAP